MSQENVEIVRRASWAFNERDFHTLEETLTPDVVVRLIGGFSEMVGQEFRGRDAALTAFKDWMSALDARGEIETIREANDRVVLIFNLVGAGTASGATTAMRTGWVCSLRDGGISAIDAYYSVEEALKAVGLEE